MVLKEMVKMQGIPYDPTLLEGPLPEQSLDPKDVADSVLYVLGTPSRVQVIFKINKLKYIYFLIFELFYQRHLPLDSKTFYKRFECTLE